MRAADFAEQVDRALESRRQRPSLVETIVDSFVSAGTAGTALYLAESARLTGRKRTLVAAREWLDTRKKLVRDKEAKKDDVPAPSGVLRGAAGRAYVDALIAGLENDSAAATRAIGRFATAWDGANTPGPYLYDGWYGVPGYACTAKDLEERGLASTPAAKANLDRVATDTLRMLDRQIAAPIASREAGSTMGLAHGIMGELAASIRVGSRSPHLRERLDELLAMAVRDARYMLWPSVTGGDVPGAIPGSRCNGVTGAVHLWCAAAERFDDPRYFDAARLAANTTADLATSGATLCCGLAGQAVALDRFGRLASDAGFRRRAQARVRRAIQVAPSLPCARLYQGQAGVALTALAMSERQPASVPPFSYGG
jgi:serine/threonine-protein kinase